jgi:Lipid A 3-O-deacylase (PagL)
MHTPTMILKSTKRYLTILAVVLIHVFPQTSDAGENWAVTVYGAGQLRGDFWSTFYSPDFEPSYYFIALAESRKIYSFLLEDVNRAIAVGYDPQTTSCTITKVATQGKNVDIYEHEKQEPLKLSLQSVSIRARFSSIDVLGGVATEEFKEYDMAANFRLPWAWYSQSGWGAGIRLMASAGVLYSDGDNALVVSLIPLIALGSQDGRFTLDMGAGGALLSRHRLGMQDFGGNFQFALTAGVGVPLFERLGVGYRFLHYSDAGIYGPNNTGADLHMLELIYRF